MKPSVFLVLGAFFASTDVPTGIFDWIAKGSIAVAFFYYLFVHEPRQRDREHARRMEANKALAETVAEAVAKALKEHPK